jgi:uncharacterized membrane protein
MPSGDKIFLCRNVRKGYPRDESRRGRRFFAPRSANALHISVIAHVGRRMGYNDALFMPKYLSRRMPVDLWLWPAALCTGLCLAIVAAPWLEARGQHGAASLLYGLYARVCHQDPVRSFTLSGHSWAVCHRCSGFYLGLWLTSMLPFEFSLILRSPRWRRNWVVAGSAPLLADVALQICGLWTNTPATRFGSGLIFGVMAASLFVPAVVEFLGGFRERRRTAELEGLS